jgi:hypothetical protein
VTPVFLEQKALREIAKEIPGHSSMPSADEYYAYVEQCIALSLRCEHPGDKAHLLQMAKAWRELAEKLNASQNSDPAKDSA